MELKFRAWFKEKETYIKPMTLQEMIHQKSNEFSLRQLNDWFIFEQYTGLKDKNGKEIYVGDIVTFKVHTRSTSEEIEYGIVDYHQGMVYISNSSGYSDEYITGVYELEVIGNIHENKELLK